MSKSKSKKSTFFWVCLILAILAVIVLAVYLVMFLLKEKYNHSHPHCKFRPNRKQSKYHHLNDMVCCNREMTENKRNFENNPSRQSGLTVTEILAPPSVESEIVTVPP